MLMKEVVKGNIGLFLRSSTTKVLLEKGPLKIYSQFTGEHPSRSVISIKLLYSFIEILKWYDEDVLL